MNDSFVIYITKARESWGCRRNDNDVDDEDDIYDNESDDDNNGDDDDI